MYFTVAAKVDVRGIHQTLRPYMIYAGQSEQEARAELASEAKWYYDRGFNLVTYTPDYALMDDGTEAICIKVKNGI